MPQRICIHSLDGVIGYVWLDGGQIKTASSAGDDRVARLVDDMRNTRNGLGMTAERFIATLPARLNNGYLWAVPEKQN